MSWVAHQNEHESSMMGLQALKWPFVAVTTTTITKLFERGWGNSVSNKHDMTKQRGHPPALMKLCIIIRKSSSHPPQEEEEEDEEEEENTTLI
jgi:hypothetical protein